MVLDRKVRQRQLSDVAARIARGAERLSPSEGQALYLVARKGTDLVVGGRSPQGFPDCRHTGDLLERNYVGFYAFAKNLGYLLIALGPG